MFKKSFPAVFVFLLMPLTVAAFSAPQINSISLIEKLPKATHHGLLVKLFPILDPSLQSFKVEISRNNGSTWTLFSNNVQPYDSRYIVLPYRTKEYGLSTNVDYQIRICANYSSETKCTDPKPLRIQTIVAGSSDDNRDGDDDIYTAVREYNIGTDPRNPDSDEDQLADVFEIGRGLDPNSTQRPLLEVENNSIDFGEGSPTGFNRSQHKILTIINNGQRFLRITNGVFTGDGADQFHYHNNMFEAVEIPPYNHRTVPIDFLPAKVGAFTAKLDILSDDKAHFPVSIDLNGVAARVGHLKVESDKQLDFGSITAGGDGLTKTVKISNPDSNVPVEISVILRETLGFIINPMKFVLGPGKSQDVEVLFVPDWNGSFEGLLEVRAGNVVGQNTFQIPIKAKADGDMSTMRLSPQIISFAGGSVGSTQKKQLIIFNDGSGALYIKKIDFGTDGDGSNKGFSVSSPSIVVPPHGSNRVEVTFTPRKTGDAASQLCIVSNQDQSASVPSTCKTARHIGQGIMYPNASHGISISGVGL